MKLKSQSRNPRHFRSEIVKEKRHRAEKALAAIRKMLAPRVALLRDGPLRGRGIGERLVEAVKARARQLELGSLYLLTTTAAPFFSQQGFSLTARSAMPSALQASRELQGVCPASATAMGFHLG
eukprot:gene54726-73125_t